MAKSDRRAVLDTGHDPLLTPADLPPDVTPDAEGRLPYHQHAANKGVEDWKLAGAKQLAGWGLGHVVTEADFDAAILAYANISIGYKE
jgi:hypothetical protein